MIFNIASIYKNRTSILIGRRFFLRGFLDLLVGIPPPIDGQVVPNSNVQPIGDDDVRVATRNPAHAIGVNSILHIVPLRGRQGNDILLLVVIYGQSTVHEGTRMFANSGQTCAYDAHRYGNNLFHDDILYHNHSSR